MNFVNMPGASITGTSFKGTIQAQLWELLAVFGTPIQLPDPPRVTYEWRIKFDDGLVVAIYDWKQGPVAHNEVVTWHIGAQHTWLVERVHEAFRARLRELRTTQAA
jgi:hypothetical protein